MGALPDKAMVPALIEPLPILVKKASYILLQGVPSNISIPKVRSEIEELRHVKSVDNVSFLALGLLDVSLIKGYRFRSFTYGSSRNRSW